MSDIDPRLTKEIASILENIVGKVDVYDGVDIDHVEMYSSREGGSSVRFFQIVSSNDDTKTNSDNSDADNK